MSKLVSTESGKIHRQAKVAEDIGSRAQDFKDESCTRDFTSCSVNISNSVRWTKDDDCSPSRVCGSLQYQDNRGDSYNILNFLYKKLTDRCLRRIEPY